MWVGGQIIFSALVPVLRRLGNDVLTPVARQLTQILWIGFALLIVTGVWNLFAVDLGSQSQAYKRTLYVKLAIVAIFGRGGLDPHARGLRPGPRALGRDDGHHGACRVAAGSRPCRITGLKRITE